MGYIGQTSFIEVIRVDPSAVRSCVPNAVLGVSKWQNPVNRFDVNGDGTVTIDDLKTLQIYYQTVGPGVLPLSRPAGAPYIDVDGDGELTARDLSQLSRYLRYGRTIDPAEEVCYDSNSFTMERDLLDPAAVNTVQQAAAAAGARPKSNYTAYLRNYINDEFTQLSYNAAVKARDSLVFIHNGLIECDPCGPHFGAGGCEPEPCIFRLIKSRLRCPTYCDGTTLKFNKCIGGEILPSRYVAGYSLPVCEVVEPDDGGDDTEPVLARTVVICIFDESDEYYVGSFTGYAPEYNYPQTPQQRYDADKALWEGLIDAIVAYPNVNVRLGLIQPYYHNLATGRPWGNLCDTCVLPKDSDRPAIDHVILPAPADLNTLKRSPRVTADEIVNMVDVVTEYGSYEPTFLLFVLDNSGSIYLSEYASQLAAAKSIIQGRYQDLVVLDDLVTARPERWLFAAYQAVVSVIATHS